MIARPSQYFIILSYQNLKKRENKFLTQFSFNISSFSKSTIVSSPRYSFSTCVYIFWIFLFFSLNHREVSQPSSVKKLCVDFSRWLAVDRDGWKRKETRKEISWRSKAKSKHISSLLYGMLTNGTLWNK